MSWLKKNDNGSDSEFHFEHSYRNINITTKTLTYKKTTELWGKSVEVAKSSIEVLTPNLAVVLTVGSFLAS